jgi:hypothetical protein
MRLTNLDSWIPMTTFTELKMTVKEGMGRKQE